MQGEELCDDEGDEGRNEGRGFWRVLFSLLLLSGSEIDRGPILYSSNVDLEMTWLTNTSNRATSDCNGNLAGFIMAGFKTRVP